MNTITVALFVIAFGELLIILHLLGQLQQARGAEKAKRTSQQESDAATTPKATSDASSTPKTTSDASSAPKTARAGSFIGHVIHLSLAQKVLGHAVTIMHIEDEEGVIHYAGIDGHDSGLVVGQTIEFWLSKETVAYETLTERQQQEDGSVAITKSTRHYLTLVQYRVLRKRKDFDDEPFAEAAQTSE